MSIYRNISHIFSFIRRIRGYGAVDEGALEARQPRPDSLRPARAARAPQRHPVHVLRGRVALTSVKE